MSKTTLEFLNIAHIKDLICVITDNETSKQIQETNKNLEEEMLIICM